MVVCARGCLNTVYSILYNVYDVWFHPTVRTYVCMYDLLAPTASSSFALLYLASVSAKKFSDHHEMTPTAPGLIQ